MRGTKPAGESQYGSASTRFPGRRNKNQGFDTTVGSTTITTTNPTINAAKTLIDTAVQASRTVSSDQIGLAKSVES